MSVAVYLGVVVVHVLAAIVWVGGVLFFALVGAPVLRTVEPPELRASLFDAIGRRFRHVGWWAVAVLLVTGPVLLAMRGWLSPDVLFRAEFWRTAAGTALAWKLALVVVMIALTAAHDVALDPRRARDAAGGAASERSRRRAVLMARFGALAAVAVVAVAARLART